MRVEAVVVALGADQLGVRAHFRDLATFNDQDAVRPFDGGEAVGDDEAGAALPSALPCPCWISASVSVSTELVASSMMKISGWARMARARLMQLLLADREQVAAFADILIVPFVQRR